MKYGIKYAIFNHYILLAQPRVANMSEIQLTFFSC